MITWRKSTKPGINGKALYEGDCLSTDTKPTENIENGSVLIEMDTGTVYFFDLENEEWRAFNA